MKVEPEYVDQWGRAYWSFGVISTGEAPRMEVRGGIGRESGKPEVAIHDADTDAAIVITPNLALRLTDALADAVRYARDKQAKQQG